VTSGKGAGTPEIFFILKPLCVNKFLKDEKVNNLV
jgi:hypothetical protein